MWPKVTGAGRTTENENIKNKNKRKQKKKKQKTKFSKRHKCRILRANFGYTFQMKTLFLAFDLTVFALYVADLTIFRLWFDCRIKIQ